MTRERRTSFRDAFLSPPPFGLAHARQGKRNSCRPGGGPEWINTKKKGLCECFAQLRSYTSTSTEEEGVLLRGETCLGGFATRFSRSFFHFSSFLARTTERLEPRAAVRFVDRWMLARSPPESQQEVDSRPEISPLRGDRFSRFSPLRRGAGGAVREPSSDARREREGQRGR